MAQPPSINITKKRVKKFISFYIQLYNTDGDAFYVDLNNGESFWLLPPGTPVSRVRCISHMSDKGEPYYESLKTKAVTWAIPEEGLSAKAQQSAKMLSKMNRAQCRAIMKDQFDEAGMNALLDELDSFAADIDEGAATLDSSEEEVESIESTSGREPAPEHAWKIPGTPGTPLSPVPVEKDQSYDYRDLPTPGTPMSPIPTSTRARVPAEVDRVAPNAPTESNAQLSPTTGSTGASRDDNTQSNRKGTESPLNSSDQVLRRKQRDLADNSHTVQGLMSGFLEKQPVRKSATTNSDEGGGEWKRRYFILNPFVLTYYQDYTDDSMNVKAKEQGEVQIFPHTMVQKCAAETDLGGQEFIFRLLNTVTGESIRLGCATEEVRDRWMNSVLNAAINLRGKGFMADTFGCYLGLLSGYKKKYFVFVGNSLHRFANEKSLTHEEEYLSVNKKTRLERVEESKGRLVLINATGDQGVVKYQLQFDITGGASSQFVRWLKLFKNKIEASAKDDAADLVHHDVSREDDSDASDVDMIVDSPKQAVAVDWLESAHIASEVSPTMQASPMSGNSHIATADPDNDIQDMAASIVPQMQAAQSFGKAPAVTEMPQLPQRPAGGPPPALAPPVAAVPAVDSAMPTAAFTDGGVEAQQDVATSVDQEPASVPLPRATSPPLDATSTAAANPEVHALMARLAQLENEAKEREEAKQKKKQQKKQNKAKAALDTVTAVSDDPPTDTLASEPTTDAAVAPVPRINKTLLTSAYLDAAYGKDDTEDEAEPMVAADGGEPAAAPVESLEPVPEHDSSISKVVDPLSASRRDKRLSVFSPTSGSAIGTHTRYAYGSDKQPAKPFAMQMFEKYCFKEDKIMDARSLQRLYYDHGFYVALDAVMRSMHGIGAVTPTTTFARATFTYEDFEVWYRVRGTQLLALKNSYIAGGDSRGTPSFAFYSRIKVCMLFRAQDNGAQDLLGYLNEEQFRRLHFRLLSQSLLYENDKGKDPTVDESLQQIVAMAESREPSPTEAVLGGRRVSTRQQIFLEDYVAWIAETCTEAISSTLRTAAPAPGGKKGLASKTRNLLRGLFGIKKTAKPKDTNHAAAVLDSIYKSKGVPVNFHADKRVIYDNEHEESGNDEQEDEQEPEAEGQDGAAGEGENRESLTTTAHNVALAYYNEGAPATEEESDDETTSDDSEDTPSPPSPPPEEAEAKQSDSEPEVLPTSEEVQHLLIGSTAVAQQPPQQEQQGPEDIYRALNSSDQNKAVGNAFAEAFAEGSASSAPGSAPVTIPAKALSALERMALSKKNGSTTASSKPAAPPAKDEFHEPLPKKPMTLKEKMAAAAEAARKKAKSLEPSTELASTQVSTSGAENSAPAISNKPQGKDIQVQEPSPPPRSASLPLPTASSRPGVNNTAPDLRIDVSNNAVSWVNSPDPASIATPIGAQPSEEPAYDPDFSFDAYGAGALSLLEDTPLRQSQGNQSPVNTAAKTKGNNRLQMLQQSSTKSSTAAVGSTFFKSAQRKQVLSFRPANLTADGTIAAPIGDSSSRSSSSVGAAAPTTRAVPNPGTSGLSSTSKPSTDLELAVLAQLGLTGAYTAPAEAWERKALEDSEAGLMATPGARTMSQVGLTPIPAASTPSAIPGTSNNASFLFTPQIALQTDTISKQLKSRRSSVSVFAVSEDASTVCRAVQTGDSSIGQSFLVAGFANKIKHKHKHAKHIHAIKEEMSAAATAAAVAKLSGEKDPTARLPGTGSDAAPFDDSGHVPKSAFHLILGERYAVDDMWLKVAEEETKISAELEIAEQEAANRIREAEMNSLLKVQYAWAERRKWKEKVQNELALAQFAVDQEAAALQARRAAAAAEHKQRSIDFTAAYKTLQTHHAAIEAERTKLYAKKVRAEMNRAMLSLNVQDAQLELSDAMRRSKDIHAQHVALDKDAALMRQKHLPQYMQHNMEHSSANSVTGVGHGHSHRSTSPTHSMSPMGRALFTSSRNANSIEKEVVFHKYDPSAVKMALHTAAQAKESRRRASMSPMATETKGAMNFRPAEYETHMQAHSDLYNQANADVVQRATMQLQQQRQQQQQEQLQRAKETAAKNRGIVRMAQVPVKHRAKPGGFLKKGAGTGGTNGTAFASAWKPTPVVTQTIAPTAPAPTTTSTPAAEPTTDDIQSDHASPTEKPIALQISPMNANHKSWKAAAPFSPHIYTGMNTTVEVAKDSHGHYDMGAIVNAHNKAHSARKRPPSPTKGQTM